MLYNSFVFLIFFPVATLLYYAIPHRFKWMYLLAVSYWFYANWNAAALALMAGITLVTYKGARLMGSHGRRAKPILVTTLVLTVLPLIAFKYFNFFAASVNGAFGMHIPLNEWLLPIGISFYTFQAMGYVIDVYRSRMGGVIYCVISI